MITRLNLDDTKHVTWSKILALIGKASSYPINIIDTVFLDKLPTPPKAFQRQPYLLFFLVGSSTFEITWVIII